MPQAYEADLRLLDLYSKLPVPKRQKNSSSESSSSSSSSEEECTGQPKQLPLEDQNPPPDPAGSTSESEAGKERVYQEALRTPFLKWRANELQKVATGSMFAFSDRMVDPSA